MHEDESDEFGLANAEEYFDEAFQYSFTGVPSSRLLQLPPEILTLIVEDVLASTHKRASSPGLRPPTTIPILKTLRAVHPHIARLRIVQNNLFRTLHLRPDPDQLRDLERDAKGFINIAPFVRRVVFEPVIVHRCDLSPARARDPSVTIKDTLGIRINRAVKEGRVLAIWTGILSRLANVSAFSLKHTQGTTWRTINCGPGAQSLLNLTLECLSKVQHGSIRNLELRYLHAEDEFVWTKIHHWENIDLSQLDTLRFDFEIDHIGDRKWDYRKTFGLESAAVLTNMLQASSSKLRKLTIRGPVNSILFNPATSLLPSLAKVHTLKLEGAMIDAACFSSWLPKLPKLKNLKLCYLGAGDESTLEDWRPIFDAIRDQSYDGLKLEIEGIRVLAAVSLRFTDTGFRHLVPSKPVREPCTDIVWSEISMMLKNYLSKTGEWYLKEHWDPANYDDEDDGDDDDEDHEDDSEFIADDSDYMEVGEDLDEDFMRWYAADLAHEVSQMVSNSAAVGGSNHHSTGRQTAPQEVDEEAEDEEIAEQLMRQFEGREPDYDNDHDHFVDAFYAEKSRRVEAREAARR